MGWQMNWILDITRSRKTAARLHDGLIRQARNPRFYESGAVADKFEARLSHAVLHAGLVLRRLAREGREGRKLARHLQEALFSGFDHALREIATGDSKTTRKIRQYAELYTGQLSALNAALDSPERMEALQAFVQRNGSAARPELAEGLARYIDAADRALLAFPGELARDGAPTFPLPDDFV